MSQSPFCPKCGAELPQDAPDGLCPKCLVAAGFESEARPDPRLDETVPSPAASGFEPPTVDQLAEHFPQLEMVELLGQGGMGAVYKARQPGLDRFVAVKILPPEVGQDPAFAERFTREARAMAKLGHPNIVAIYDFGQADGLFYFVMEYIDGANLRQTMQSGRLKPEEALAVVPQICDALQYAHDEGVVHRDIKPENILLDKKGRVKIADFGLSKLMVSGGRESVDVSLTGTHQVMGTIRYMAPEQMQGTKSVDHRADIYSLGVVFYELLTGDVPMGSFEPPSKKVQVDVRLDEVVLRALAQEPDKRYQHASDVKTDVESVTYGTHEVRPRMPVPTDEHPLLAAARFWMTPQPGYGRSVGVWLLIVTAIYMVTQLTVTFTVPQRIEWPHMLTMYGGPVLIVLIGLILHLRWSVKTNQRPNPLKSSAVAELRPRQTTDAALPAHHATIAHRGWLALFLVVILGGVATGAWVVAMRSHRTPIFYPYLGDTGFVEGRNGPEVGPTMIAKLGIPAAQVDEANRVFQNYFKEYVSLERRHTKHSRDAAGHVRITIEPFPGEMHELVNRLASELGGIVEQGIAPLMPEKGKVHTQLGLFRFAGEATVKIDLWKDTSIGKGNIYHCDEEYEWLDGSKSGLGTEGPTAECIPKQYQLYWTELE